MAVKYLQTINEAKCTIPQGAMFILLDIENFFGCKSRQGILIDSGDTFCKCLLEEHYVAITSGEEFYSTGTARISFAVDRNVLEDACTNLVLFCRSLVQTKSQ